MGVDGLSSLVKKAGEEMNLNSLHGLHVGVDASIWMHKALVSVEASRLFAQKPPVPVPMVRATLLELYRRLIAVGATVVFVFEGLRFPPKSGEDERRRMK